MRSLTGETRIVHRVKTWVCRILCRPTEQQLLKILENIMPLTLTLTEGVIPAGSEKEAVAKITSTTVYWATQS